MNKIVKHIVEGFDFGNISNDNPSKNITRNLRRTIDDYINENVYKFLHKDTSIDPEFFDMVACYKPKDRDELDDLVAMADMTYNGKCNLNWIDVSGFKYLNSLFYNSRFNGDISKWDVSNCEEMSSMFARSFFKGDISEWETGSCKNMSEMFQDTEFNGDISKWDVSNVRNMDGMFSRSKFNGDISNWDVSNVETMNNMFEHSKFNGDLSKWDVHNVKEMMGIFDDAAFIGDISDWDIYDNLEQGKASIIEHIQWYYNVHKQDKPRLLQKIKKLLGLSESFDFNAVKKQNKSINIGDDVLLPQLKALKKGDEIHYGDGEYYFGEPRHIFDETAGYVAITAEEAEDGIPRVMAAHNLRMDNNYDTIYYGGKLLIKPDSFSISDGYKNTQEQIKIGGGDARENKRKYEDENIRYRAFDYDKWPNRHPYEFYAAKLCHEHGYNGTKGKWYLPSIEELIKTFDSDKTEDMFEVDDYKYTDLMEYTLDSIMFATSTLAKKSNNKIEVQMFHGPVFRSGMEKLEGLIRPVDTECYIRPFIKITDLFGIS